MLLQRLPSLGLRDEDGLARHLAGLLDGGLEWGKRPKGRAGGEGVHARQAPSEGCEAVQMANLCALQVGGLSKGVGLSKTVGQQ